MATLIFDLDGTLLDCRARHYAVYSQALQEMGYEPLPEADYWRRRRNGEGTFDVTAGLPGDAARSFRITWFDRIERRDYLAMDRPFDGVASGLIDLAKSNQLVLLTLRRDPAALVWQLEKTRLAQYFHEVISPAVNVPSAKFPSRKSELAADWYPIGETWVIGDSDADIDLASDLGAHCVCVTSGVRSEGYLRTRGGALTMESVAELSEFMSHSAPTREPSGFAVLVPDTAPVVRGSF